MGLCFGREYTLINLEKPCNEAAKDDPKLVEGVYHYKDGCKYAGEFSNGTPNGKGTWYHTGKFSGDRYEGAMINGKFCGIGTYYSRNGDIRTGEWKDDSMNGYGRYEEVNGYKYEGKFVKDIFDGYGISYEGKIGENTYKIVYDGQWYRGNRNGQGLEIIHRIDGSVEVYRGTWENGKKQGYFVVTLDGRQFFEGTYENGIAKK